MLERKRKACWKMYKQRRNSWSEEWNSRRRDARSGPGLFKTGS